MFIIFTSKFAQYKSIFILIIILCIVKDDDCLSLKNKRQSHQTSFLARFYPNSYFRKQLSKKAPKTEKLWENYGNDNDNDTSKCLKAFYGEISPIGRNFSNCLNIFINKETNKTICLNEDNMDEKCSYLTTRWEYSDMDLLACEHLNNIKQFNDIKRQVIQKNPNNNPQKWLETNIKYCTDAMFSLQKNHGKVVLVGNVIKSMSRGGLCQIYFKYLSSLERIYDILKYNHLNSPVFINNPLRQKLENYELQVYPNPFLNVFRFLIDRENEYNNLKNITICLSIFMEKNSLDRFTIHECPCINANNESSIMIKYVDSVEDEISEPLKCPLKRYYRVGNYSEDTISIKYENKECLKLTTEMKISRLDSWREEMETIFLKRRNEMAHKKELECEEEKMEEIEKKEVEEDPKGVEEEEQDEKKFSNLTLLIIDSDNSSSLNEYFGNDNYSLIEKDQEMINSKLINSESYEDENESSSSSSYTFDWFIVSIPMILIVLILAYVLWVFRKHKQSPNHTVSFTPSPTSTSTFSDQDPIMSKNEELI